MSPRALAVILAGIGWLSPAAAHEGPAIVTAQLDCASLPPGPARTDCYIALSRINQQQVEIAAGEARRSRDIARHHKVTGQHRNAKARAAKQR
jgi:hypothetical protein